MGTERQGRPATPAPCKTLALYSDISNISIADEIIYLTDRVAVEVPHAGSPQIVEEL
jgi:hypothetical protein